MARSSQQRKCYGQVCPMATALDVIGDRWTPLILRELLGGPARFNQVQEGLPGIPKNLLVARLRRLETDGIIRRVRSHGSVLYSLTDLGAGIRTTLEELAFWGARVPRPGPIEHDRSIRAIAMAFQAVLARRREALPDPMRVIELEVDGEYLEFRLGPRPSVTVRPSTDADVRIRVSKASLTGFLRGEPLREEHFIRVAGDAAAGTALLDVLAG